MSCLLRNIFTFFLKDRRFYLYIAIGGSAALINITSRYLLSEKVCLRYDYSLALAYIAGLLWNFSLNKYVNYKAHGQRYHVQLVKFVLVAAGGLALTVVISKLLAYLLTGYFEREIGELLAHIIAVGLVMLYSFSMHTIFTFKE